MHSGGIGSAELAELTARRAHREYHLKRDALERVSKLLATVDDPDEGVTADLHFKPGPGGHPQIDVHVGGDLPLVCQRCLEAVWWQLELDARLTVVPAGGSTSGLADPFDVVEMPADGLPVAALIEDEILASLPLAPMHGPGQCVPPGAGRGKPAVEQVSDGPRTQRPFADLRDRMGRKSDD